MENPYRLHAELGELMMTRVGVVRENNALTDAYHQLQDLQQRANSIGLADSSGWTNQALAYARQVQEMIRLSAVITKSASARNECRGAHHKPEFELTIPAGKFVGDPEFEDYLKQWKANNDRWLKTTLAEHSSDGPVISYATVDTSAIPPEHPRDYR